MTGGQADKLKVEWTGEWKSREKKNCYRGTGGQAGGRADGKGKSTNT